MADPRERRRRKTDMKAGQIFILLLCGALLTAMSGPAGGRQLGGEALTFDLSYTLTFTNARPAPVSLTMRVPLPGDAPGQKTLSTALSPRPSGRAQGSATFAFPAVKPGGRGECTVTVKVRKTRRLFDIDALAAAVPKPLPARLRPFTAPTAELPCADAAVRQEARLVVAGETNPYYRVVKLYDYVRSFTFALDRAPRPTVQALKSRAVQCSDAACVLVTMCRALGIPARYCGGVFLKPDVEATAETHAWCEVYLEPEGWLPFDPTMGRFDDATRLTRMAELQSGYVLLWRDTPEGFRADARGSKGRAAGGGELRVAFRYRSTAPPRGSSAEKLFPDFALPGAVPAASKALYIAKGAGTRDVLARGVALLRAGKAAEAESLFRKALALEPGLWISHRELVEAACRAGRAEALRREYEARRPDALVDYVLGCLALEGKEYGEAQRRLEKSAAAGGDNFLVRHGLGDLYLRTKQAGRAYRAMKRALELNPLSPPTFRNLADLYLMLEDWNSLARVCDRAYAATAAPEYLADAGQAHLRRGDPRAALGFFRRAVAAAPREGLYRALLGEGMLRLGDRKGAARELSAGIGMGLAPHEREYFTGLLKDARGGNK